MYPKNSVVVSCGASVSRIAALLLCLLSLSVKPSFANHLFGGELFYTYVSGNTYSVTMILYGDCGNTSGSFAFLATANPQVDVFNGTSFIQTLSLTPQPGSGINVSPVCPDEINNTTCNNGTLPGVKKFIYATNVTLSGPSAGWRFRSNGNLTNSSTGRSTAITNIVIPTSGSIMALEATLDNTVAPNTSPVYTTIPTPFFCINKPQEYNQGAVDANGDSLAFQLVPGLIAGTTATVTYISPYTAANPLACSPGTFQFNTGTGQLSFTPNLVQDALVVGKVSEYRNGVLVGTSMREMTFVVLNNCNNNPPNGTISNPVNGTLVNDNTIKVCSGNLVLSFNIPVNDPDGDNITLTTQGLPAGASTTVTGNGTPNPNFSFSWNIAAVAPGTYTFYITYTDDGCPLTSKQTVAYTVQVLPKPGISFALLEPATCVQKAKFTVTPIGTDPPYTFNAYLGGNSLALTVNNITGTITDSLAAGSYTFRVTGANGCYRDTVISFIVNVNITPQVSWTQPFCPGGNTGTITIGATGSNTPFQYAINSLPYSATTLYTGLSAGTHIVHIKDAQGCVKDSSITITNPPAMILGLSVKKPVCSPVSNGQIMVSPVNGTAPYQYALNTGPYSSASTFTGLATGTYTLHVKDAHDCTKDTTITLTDSLQMQLATSVSNVLCYGNSNGSVALTPSGTTPPYSYAMGAGTFGTASIFSNLAAGTYVFHIRDQNLCLKDTTIVITQPAPLSFSLSMTNVPCFGASSGSVAVNAQGGTPAYLYAVNSGAFQASSMLNGLPAGTHAIHLKDNNGCTKDTTVILTQPASAVAFGSIALTNPTCEGFTDGQVTLSGTGGTPPYTYAFGNSNFGSPATFDQISEGTYTFRIKDANGCTRDTILTLTGFPHILIDEISLTQPSCFGLQDGSLSIAASGGAPPFTYRLGTGGSWSSSNLFSNQKAGEYTLRVKDANQCIKDTTVVLGQPDKLLLDTLTVGNDCNGIDDGGIIEVIASGGTAPYAYFWQHDESLHNARITGLVNGRYYVLVTDAHHCSDSLTVDILYNNCCTPFIPNAFTPNGDGKNDIYRVEYKGDMELKEMYIYNRYGQRVFSSSNVSKVWDGTFDGKPVDNGTYYYYIRILCGNVRKKELTFKGDVTLIR